MTTTMNFTTMNATDFAKKFNFKVENVKLWLTEARNCSYVNKPAEAIKSYVNKLDIEASKKEYVYGFLYANLFNNSPVPFYNDRGWGTTICATPRG